MQGKYENSPTSTWRLKNLKREKFLSKRFFIKISENMHYEIFKYMTQKDLLNIRACKLGGYQLTSNELLRSRIKNYFRYFRPDLDLGEDSNVDLNIKRISLINEQGKKKLNFEGLGINALGMNQFVKVLPYVSDLLEIRFDQNMIRNDGLEILSINFKYLSHLRILSLFCCWIGNIIPLAENLQYVPNLATLNLKLNNIQGWGLDYLANNLKYIPNLQVMDIGGNNIENTFNFMENINCIPNLHTLDLSGNSTKSIGSLGCLSKLRKLYCNNKINIHSVVGNGIANSILGQFIEISPLFHDLEKLHLGDTAVNKEIIKKLSICMKYLPKLQTLWLCVEKNIQQDMEVRSLISYLETQVKLILKTSISFFQIFMITI